MQAVKMGVAGVVALTAMVAAAGAVPSRIAAFSTRPAVLVAGQCPRGYHWAEDGYDKHAKYRPAHCARD